MMWLGLEEGLENPEHIMDMASQGYTTMMLQTLTLKERWQHVPPARVTEFTRMLRSEAAR